MGKISSFITGAAIGVAAALLLAPKTGEQTRALVTEKANSIVGEAKDFGAGMPGAAQDVIKSAREKGSEFVKSATDAGQDLVSGIKGSDGAASAEPDDELRAKIEAVAADHGVHLVESQVQQRYYESDGYKETVARNTFNLIRAGERLYIIQ